MSVLHSQVSYVKCKRPNHGSIFFRFHHLEKIISQIINDVNFFSRKALGNTPFLLNYTHGFNFCQFFSRKIKFVTANFFGISFQNRLCHKLHNLTGYATNVVSAIDVKAIFRGGVHKRDSRQQCCLQRVLFEVVRWCRSRRGFGLDGVVNRHQGAVDLGRVGSGVV